ncbi:glycoside hydrolase family 16 protein, partial [Sphaerobolus stellatus SS14]
LSFLPGQRVSACTCANTNVPADHPGPSPSKGRGAPEIDVIEAQIDTTNREGQASQSFQVAPFNALYQFDNSSSAVNITDKSITKFNPFKGSITQQAISGVTQLGTEAYGGKAFQKYGYEWWSNPGNRDEGYISWYVGNKTSWSLNPKAVGPEKKTEISQRIIPEEPMSLVFNLGMSPGFQPADFQNLVFPARMLVDYVRIYQKDGVEDGLTCNPKAYPTSDYIQAHLNAYQNANLTTWKQAGYSFPGNSLLGQCT